MASKADYPFDGYTLYVVYHKKEGRRMAQLVSKTHRTTLSYARYQYCVKHGRILDKNEHVDHIDDDKSNDRIENLQILSQAENIKKQARLKPAKIVDKICPVCGTMFKFDNRNIKFRPVPTCSRSCGGRKKSLGI